MKQKLLLGGYTRHGGAGIYTGTFDDTRPINCPATVYYRFRFPYLFSRFR